MSCQSAYRQVATRVVAAAGVPLAVAASLYPSPDLGGMGRLAEDGPSVDRVALAAPAPPTR